MLLCAIWFVYREDSELQTDESAKQNVFREFPQSTQNNSDLVIGYQVIDDSTSN